MIVTRLGVRAIEVPLRRPLGTSAQRLGSAPFLLLDLETDGGVVGRAYLFCYDRTGQRVMADVVRDAADLVVGATLDPAALRATLNRRWRLFGATGGVGMALAGIDVAAWDAVACAAGVPLAEHLGGALLPIPAYNSNGLGLLGPSAVAREAGELVAEGYREIKLRLGYATLEEDLAAVGAVRDAVGDATRVLVDYNQLLDRSEGLRRCAALDRTGIGWIEEPVAHDDYAGAATIAARIDTPLQIGENLAGTHAVEAALAAHASDLVMFDLQRIGGVSGWLEASALLDGRVPLSSHLFPEVSVHLLAVSPSRDRLEMVDWATPFLREPLIIANGRVAPLDRPGTGVAWDEAAVERYRC